MLLPFIIAVLISVDVASRTNILFLGAHLAALEKRINNLMGKDLLLWEHSLPFARIGADMKLHDAMNEKQILNPLFCRYPIIILVVVLVYGVSVFKGTVYLLNSPLPCVVAWLFAGITIFMFLYLAVMTYVGMRKLPAFYDNLISAEWQGKRT